MIKKDQKRTMLLVLIIVIVYSVKSISSYNSLKKFLPRTFDISARSDVSILFFARHLYIDERLHPNCFASHPAVCFCLSSSSFITCPMLIISALFNFYFLEACSNSNRQALCTHKILKISIHSKTILICKSNCKI